MEQISTDMPEACPDFTVSLHGGSLTERCPVTAEKRLHSHHCCEIVLLLRGSGDFVTGRTAVPVMPQNLLLIQADCPHSLAFRDQAAGYLCHFEAAALNARVETLLQNDLHPQAAVYAALQKQIASMDAFREPAAPEDLVPDPACPQAGIFRLSQARAECFAAILERLEKEQEQKLPGYRELQYLLLSEFLIRLNRLVLQDSGLPAPDGAQPDSAPDQKELIVSNAVRIMESSLNRPVSCVKIAAQNRVSVSYFRKIFKEATGLSPHDYFSRMRILHTLKLLQTTKLSVSEISESIGIFDYNYFSRLFKKTIGHPPTYYKAAAGPEMPACGTRFRRLNTGAAMKNYEIGVLPNSTYYTFSQTAEVQNLFYYPIACGHEYCNEEFYIKRNFYSPLLLTYICSGTLYLETEGSDYQVSSHQLLLFDCRHPHYYYAKGNLEFYYLHFDGPRAHELCAYLNRANGLVIGGDYTEPVYERLKEMVDFYEGGGTESVFSSSARIYSLLSLLDNPLVSPHLKKNDESINKTVFFIRTHSNEKITLAQLAGMAGLSTYYYSHVFKEIVGFSPTEYIINTRIDEAKKLLEHSSLSIGEISKRIGYASSSNLVPLFMDRVGCTPKDFRKKLRSENVR